LYDSPGGKTESASGSRPSNSLNKISFQCEELADVICVKITSLRHLLCNN
jgi:hypothetical protein